MPQPPPPAQPAPLDGLVAVVTGGGRGIGRAIAERLAADGAAVCVTDLDDDVSAATAAAIEQAGGQCIAVTGDVRRVEDCSRWAQTAADRFGDLHMLVNNAGVTRDGMVHRMGDDDWDLVQDVVLRGAFNMVRAVAPWFRDRDRPAPRRMVNIASVAGVHGVAGNVNYVAAKAGLIGLTLAMAKEWAPFGVTANAIAPGLIQTRLTDPREGRGEEGRGIPADVRQALIDGIPAGRLGTPEDVAHATAYFCSPGAGYVTGQVLEVHGGAPDLSVLGRR